MPDAPLDLDEISARLGFAEPPEVLEAAATPLARGHHLALLAAEGSGKGGVFGLAALTTCDPEEESTQALILVPEAGHAWRVAAAVQRVAGPQGLIVACPSASPGERPDANQAAPPHVLVGRPSRLLPEIRSGRHSISQLRLLILDRVADLQHLDEWSSVEPILETLPKECRKIAVSHRADPGFLDLIERQMPRARRWPEALLPVGMSAGEEDGTEPTGEIRCAVALPGDAGAALERCIRDADGLGCAGISMWFDAPATARRLSAELAVAGLPVDDGEEDRTVRIRLPGEGADAAVQVDLPLRIDALRAAFDGDGPRYAVIEPRHLAQMDILARRLGRRLQPLRGQVLGDELDPIRHYRMRIRESAEDADLVSELLVLEPLFEELGAVRVAGIVSGLLRRQTDEAGALRPWADVEAASTVAAPSVRPSKARRGSDVPRGARPAWTRLYFGVGRRDEAKPGDLVGAITGETGIAGAQIGKIEIMGNFSLVDVDSQVADEVMRKLDGVTIRGRDVPVRRDREG